MREIDQPRETEATPWLVCHAGAHRCALPLASVVETMRPLPVEHLTGAPAFVSGLSIIRGVPTPVVALSMLLDGRSEEHGRFVTVKTGDRCIAFGVGGVVGVRSVAAATAGTLPPLLRQADGSAVGMIGTLDSELLLLLQTARIVPDELVQRIMPQGRAP